MTFHRRVRRARLEGNTPWISLEDNLPSEILNIDNPLPSFFHLVFTEPPPPHRLAPTPTRNNVLAWHVVSLSEVLEKPEHKIFTK